MTILELKNKWNKISPLTGGYLLVSSDHPLSFHVGYYNGVKNFIILNTGKITAPSSKAIKCSCIETGSNEYSLSFSLLYESLEELFIKLCWDLIEFTRSSSNPIEEILKRYINWIDLLQKVKEGLLSYNAQKGLIGEMLYLNELIGKLGEDIAINSWVGPEGNDQDFLLPNGWSEIKSVSIAATEVCISSLQQLDRDDEGKLVIYFMDRTSADIQDLYSIYSIFNELKTKITQQTNIDLFVCKLAKIGLFEKDIEQYKDIHFRFSEKRVYCVSKGFPKLTRNNVPIEILSAKYGIDLATINPYRLEE